MSATRTTDGMLRRWLVPRGSRRHRLTQLALRAAAVARRKGRRVVQVLGRPLRPLVDQWAIDDALGHLASVGTPGASSPPATQPYAVVCLPIIPWTYRFQRPQQLMRQFAEHGHPVLYASHEFLLMKPLATQPVAPGVTELRLRGHAGRNIYREVMAPSDAHAAVETLRRCGFGEPGQATVVVVQLPFWAALAEELRQAFGWPIVYDCMDDLAGFSHRGGTKNAMLAMEERLFQTADLVVVSSDYLVEKAKPRARRVALVRNGVDFDHFAQVADTPSQTPPGTRPLNPVVGYYGAIAHWFDGELLADLATSRPGWHFQLIGDTYSANVGRLRECPNVEFLGERPYGDLPRLIADWDCCVIPFRRIPLTEATNPVKVYEMLAAGKPVVAVDLPELRPIAAAGLIEIGNTAEQFAARIEQTVMANGPTVTGARRAFAQANTWTERFGQLDAAIRAADLLPLP